MTSPQCENGFARMANELLEALARTTFTSQETKVLFYVIRKTYGFSQKDAIFKPGEIAKNTGLLRQNSYKATIRLKTRKILNVIQLDYGARISINKYYDKWVDVIPADDGGASSRRITGVIQVDSLPYKETLKKNSLGKLPSDFGVTKDMVSWFESASLKNIDLYSATQNFIDHFRASGEEKADWIAAWRKSLRLQEKWEIDKLKTAAKNKYQFPTCSSCGYQATNIIKGQPCPYCNMEA